MWWSKGRAAGSGRLNVPLPTRACLCLRVGEQRLQSDLVTHHRRATTQLPPTEALEHWRDLVTQRLAAISFYASNRDDALASAAPVRHFPVHESNNGSGAYSATWLERRPCWPYGTPLLSSSAEYGDCSGKEQRTLCNAGTCMTKANSWRATTPAYRQAPLKLLLAPHPEQKPKPKKNFLCLTRRKCQTPKKIRPAHRSKSPRSNW
jgi:hypothetical protein